MCALAAIMAIAAVNFTADAHAKPADATLSAIMAVQVPIDTGQTVAQPAIAAEEGLADAATAVTGHKIAAYDAARSAVIQRGAEQSVPIVTAAAVHEIAGKETATTATITSSIIYVATMPAAAHFQPPALTAT